MDIDVKNALERLLLACDNIQSNSRDSDEEAANIKKTVVNDIICFIFSGLSYNTRNTTGRCNDHIK